MRARRIAQGVAMAAVVGAYVFFATAGTMRFRSAPAVPEGWDEPGRGYYAQLAEGFLQGNTYLAFSPDPRMEALRDPYDYGQRDQATIGYLWDASWYRGKYYLYFTPLPVVLFYAPYRLITGQHADDTLAGAFFSVWIFVAAVIFLRRAGAARVLWIVFVGLANLLPFALSSVRVYEVAILCAVAFSTSWAAALLRFHESPSVGSAVWTALWLSLAIAARPNLIVLVIPTAIVFLRHRRARILLAAAIPVVVTAIAYLTYNAVRFGNAFETGISYQLTYVPMRGLTRCSLCTAPEIFRFVDNALQYTFTPPALDAQFPHAAAATAHIDKSVAWPGGEPEEIIGVVPFVPLTILATVFAARSRRAALILGGAWLVLLALSTCWWIVSRYAFDFQILLLLGTAATLESQRPRIVIGALAVYSIVLALLLGLEGRGGLFRRQNPALLQKMGDALHVKVRQ